MASRDLRGWIAQLEAAGELKRVKVKVDWDDEISEIIRTVYKQGGPALLFENIKDHENTWCTKLFTNAFGTQDRVNMIYGLPGDTSTAELIKTLRSRMKKPIPPVRLETGPVKENIIRGDDIDLFQIPVPKWHPLDGGRYINTFYYAVTRDTDTGINNAGIYRGMIIDKNRIGNQIMSTKDWGILYSKYKEMGEPMPVAFVYGYDPALLGVAGTPVLGSEYDLAGGLRGEAIELVRCETSDIEVPAYAEIVVEGTISPDPGTYEIEGPFGEGSGHYGDARKRPVLKVDCITHRNDPIFRGALIGTGSSLPNELTQLVGNLMCCVTWNTLENAEIPGILDVAIGPLSAVKIHKTYQGQARQVAAALWGSKFAGHHFNALIVCEEDVDIHNPMELLSALHHKVDFDRSLINFPLEIGSPIDVSVPYDDRDEQVYGASRAHKLLIDATTDWYLHPIREEYGYKRVPPICHNSRADTQEYVAKRWQEYGI